MRSIHLKLHTTIQKIVSALLLTIFTISIIPKSLFHDLVANHTDEVVCKHAATTGVCVHVQGYHCGFDNFVVTAPYLLTNDEGLCKVRAIYPLHQAVIKDNFFQEYFFTSESRGPPKA